MWHIGQRVVCVSYKGKYDFVVRLNVGDIYTIREVRTYPDYEYGLLLEEIVNKPHQWRQGFRENSYHHLCFKPLDEKRIDIFRAMLKSKEKEKVA